MLGTWNLSEAIFSCAHRYFLLVVDVHKCSRHQSYGITINKHKGYFNLIIFPIQQCTLGKFTVSMQPVGLQCDDRLHTFMGDMPSSVPAI
jgi:hypothetical protein